MINGIGYKFVFIITIQKSICNYVGTFEYILKIESVPFSLSVIAAFVSVCLSDGSL